MPLKEFVVSHSNSLEKSMHALFESQHFQNKSFEVKNWANHFSAPFSDEIIETIEKN